MKKMRYFNPAYLAWIGGFLALYLFVMFIGLPHVIWNYYYNVRWDEAEQRNRRHYLHCTYVGPHGHFEQSAKDGACDWFIFRTKQRGAMD